MWQTPLSISLIPRPVQMGLGTRQSCVYSHFASEFFFLFFFILHASHGALRNRTECYQVKLFTPCSTCILSLTIRAIATSSVSLVSTGLLFHTCLASPISPIARLTLTEGPHVLRTHVGDTLTCWNLWDGYKQCSSKSSNNFPFLKWTFVLQAQSAKSIACGR